MTPESVINFGQQALYIAMLIGAPLLLTALAVGLIIGMVQAATQINEATLSFIPKLLGVFAALVIAGPWMVSVLVDYIQKLFESIPHVIG